MNPAQPRVRLGGGVDGGRVEERGRPGTAARVMARLRPCPPWRVRLLLAEHHEDEPGALRAADRAGEHGLALDVGQHRLQHLLDHPHQHLVEQDLGDERLEQVARRRLDDLPGDPAHHVAARRRAARRGARRRSATLPPRTTAPPIVPTSGSSDMRQPEVGGEQLHLDLGPGEHELGVEHRAVQPLALAGACATSCGGHRHPDDEPERRAQHRQQDDPDHDAERRQLLAAQLGAEQGVDAECVEHVAAEELADLLVD